MHARGRGPKKAAVILHELGHLRPKWSLGTGKEVWEDPRERIVQEFAASYWALGRTSSSKVRKVLKRIIRSVRRRAIASYSFSKEDVDEIETLGMQVSGYSGSRI